MQPTLIPSFLGEGTRLSGTSRTCQCYWAARNKAGSSVTTLDRQPVWTRGPTGWGKPLLLRVATLHRLALWTESTAMEKTLFLFMSIFIARMFCLYQHAALDYMKISLLKLFPHAVLVWLIISYITQMYNHIISSSPYNRLQVSPTLFQIPSVLLFNYYCCIHAYKWINI